MPDPAGIPALLDAIRHLHGVEAKHLETVHVHEVAAATGGYWSVLNFSDTLRLLT